MTTTLTTDEAIQIFTEAKRPFVGRLIDSNPPKDGECRYCAQGLILSRTGNSDADLLSMSQAIADAEIAKRLGISRAESILLRKVNDDGPGLPQAVLILTDAGIGSVIGAEWRIIVSLWRHMESMTPDAWAAARAAAWAAARAAAGEAAWAAARAAAGEAAGAAAWAAARAAAGAAAWAAARAAAGATAELQGRSRIKKFFFLPMFGFATPDAIPLTV